MKQIFKLYFILCTVVFFTVPSFAYVDPSVMTYAIQIVAGILIAVGAVISAYIRKAKKKVADKLGIDETLRKEFEEDVVEIMDDEEK